MKSSLQSNSSNAFLGCFIAGWFVVGSVFATVVGISIIRAAFWGIDVFVRFQK